jgi:hypothetical protein
MRAGIVIFIITALVIANIYTEGKILKKMASWKKYYQMGGVAVGAFVVHSHSAPSGGAGGGTQSTGGSAGIGVLNYSWP